MPVVLCMAAILAEVVAAVCIDKYDTSDKSKAVFSGHLLAVGRKELERPYYNPNMTWKRGPVPDSCPLCHDTIGYHKPDCKLNPSLGKGGIL